MRSDHRPFLSGYNFVILSVLFLFFLVVYVTCIFRHAFMEAAALIFLSLYSRLRLSFSNISNALSVAVYCVLTMTYNPVALFYRITLDRSVNVVTRLLHCVAYTRRGNVEYRICPKTL